MTLNKRLLQRYTLIDDLHNNILSPMSSIINLPGQNDWVFLLLIKERMFAYNIEEVIYMLTDYQRKVLRILYNYKGGRRRFPTIHELTVKTGKHKPDVMAALDALVTEEYIHWEDRSDTANIVILEGWEREGERPKVDPTPPSGNIDYWTQY